MVTQQKSARAANSMYAADHGLTGRPPGFGGGWRDAFQSTSKRSLN
jgi:hypothetical protein